MQKLAFTNFDIMEWLWILICKPIPRLVRQ